MSRSLVCVRVFLSGKVHDATPAPAPGESDSGDHTQPLILPWPGVVRAGGRHDKLGRMVGASLLLTKKVKILCYPIEGVIMHALLINEKP